MAIPVWVFLKKNTKKNKKNGKNKESYSHTCTRVRTRVPWYRTRDVPKTSKKSLKEFLFVFLSALWHVRRNV